MLRPLSKWLDPTASACWHPIEQNIVLPHQLTNTFEHNCGLQLGGRLISFPQWSNKGYTLFLNYLGRWVSAHSRIFKSTLRYPGVADIWKNVCGMLSTILSKTIPYSLSVLLLNDISNLDLSISQTRFGVDRPQSCKKTQSANGSLPTLCLYRSGY